MINSTTKLVGLLGHPIKQSFSPSIHNYLFKKYNQNNIYCCFDVKESDLEEAVRSIKTLNMRGCNVTIPHKVNVMKFLENIDKNARLIGAVNTIKNDEGFLTGYNTDGLGFVKSILDKGYDLNNKKIMIIGAGGSSRSIAVQLASNKVKSIEIRNRSIQKAMEISEIIRDNFKIASTYSNKTIDKNDIEDIDILINTTPVGMESNECPIDESIRVKGDLLVCDIVYKPQNTSFIKWAKSNNLDVVYGIDMLINQGLEAFYIWTGIKPSKEDELYLKGLYYDQVD
ncbi:shikimate dehydrogenase [Romboutsia sp. MSSM.1001216sp_RTP31141st1_G3_RTP31141_220114]|uniref:shikimate dehydrogenase n=1 Tax=unclassified Romboutsia TaxID=2626894 RepID=UPI0031B5C405